MFKKIDELPKKKRKLDIDIIVEGEATGHAHRIRNGTLYSSWQRGPRLYMKRTKELLGLSEWKKRNMIQLKKLKIIKISWVTSSSLYPSATDFYVS